MSLPNFQLRIYRVINNELVDFKFINSQDILEMQIDNNAFPDYSKLQLVLKPYQIYTNLANKDIEKYPLVIKWYNVNQEIKKIFYVLSREHITEISKEYVLINCGSFEFFEQNRIVNSNKNFTTTDPDNIPEEFATYTDSGRYDIVLRDLYLNTFLAPKKPTYGILPNVDAPERKVKGISGILVDYYEDVDVTINVDYATTLTESKQKIFNQLGYFLEEKSDIVDNKIKVSFQKGTSHNFDLIKKNNEIIKYGSGLKNTTNAVLGVADPNNYVYLSNVAGDEFTAREIVSNSQFINGSNYNYLLNTTNTILSDEKKDRILKILEIKDLNNDYTAGDFVDFENTKYRIKSISYKLTPSTYTKNLEIEEVTNGI